MCAVSTDARVEERWGAGYIARKYGVHGVESIWGPHEGILPCPVYLRHCVLSAKKQVRATWQADDPRKTRSTTLAWV